MGNCVVEDLKRMLEEALKIGESPHQKKLKERKLKKKRLKKKAKRKLKRKNPHKGTTL